ncbi:MAG: hypothetical protein MRK02_13395 [Candidatus Scalindua sp.]|nr:hypothetical protein [Candidatus Scalindua sp.]
MRIHIVCLFVVCIAFILAESASGSEQTCGVDYTIALHPDRDSATVSICLENGALFNRLDFHLKPDQQSDLHADGKLRIDGDRAIWEPPEGQAVLSLTAKLTHQRKSGKYDARMTPDWAIFRGDDMIPAVKVRTVKDATFLAKLHFVLPPGWTNVDTGWPREPDGSFTIDNPRRRFDRPVGWMIAGKVGTRREIIGSTEICVGAPVGSTMHRMDILTFINFIWRDVVRTFEKIPGKLLLVGANDPMWRGGLSSPNSLFLHADLPLISENTASSTLIHELTHVITRIRGELNDDWIAEGLAEYYSIELIYRAGGMSEARYQKARNWLALRSHDVTTLRVVNSKGPVTARAVILFQDLDKEIRRLTKEKYNIDDVTRKLMKQRKVSLDDLRRISEQLVGGKIVVLDTPLLK